MSLRDKTTRYKSSRVEEQRGAAFQQIGTYLGLRLVGTISPTSLRLLNLLLFRPCDVDLFSAAVLILAQSFNFILGAKLSHPDARLR